ncbi:MAG TPA: class I tRNA ligase family protein, partial [bacterium]|nr:class I tRNA ligase family protein [bacterium]
MPLLIHDTMTRSTRPFEPIIPGKVRMYVCGVTVYDISHVGHARKEVAFDVVYRWLRHLGYEVTYVRNFTDVDDKIIKRANERGVRPEAISDEYIRAFRDDMGKLGLFDVTVEPRATEHIPEMIDVIAQLIERGHAYVAGSGVDRDVYFSVPSYPAYGKLSHRKLEDMRAGARVEVGEQKKDPA